MKKYLLLLAAFLLFTAADSKTAKQEIIEVPLNTELPDNGIPRGAQITPISCYVLTSLGELILYSNSLSSTASVEIENTSTGVLIQESIILGSVPVSIGLSGPGDYAVKVTLLSGSSYVGVFFI